ncbi:MAG: homoserine dehydrogenase [Veillonellaceae bacterium]|nr:homoserine dehydrogenase [Veillonellaceae bacterium]
MEKVVRVGLLGFGTVGTGVVRVLTENASLIAQRAGTAIEIKKILVRDPYKKRALSTAAELTTDPASVIRDPEIDIVAELLGGEEPARTLMLEALNQGKHVVTANKDVMAKYGRELFEAAEKNNVNLLFEASVGGGIPIIRPLKRCLAANRISEVMGIVNGTTNYMLDKMTSEGMDFATVLAEAQAKGYAEADPTADVGGLDAARKIAILASIAFGTRVRLDDVSAEGITKIEPEDIDYGRELGYVIKLLAIAQETDKGVNARVHPAFIPLTHPLAAVRDAFNAIFIRGDAVGDAMFYGRGAGSLPTASAVCADIMEAAREIAHHSSSHILCTCFEEKRISPISETESPYYIRLLAEDKPGVMAAIAGAVGAQQVSLNSVIQKRRVGSRAEIVLITYKVKDADLQLAVQTLSGLSVVNKVSTVIRVVGVDAD